MSVQFATIDEFRDYQGLPPRGDRPADAEEAAVYDADTYRLNALLKRSSDRVIRATRLARVRLDRTGHPSDDRIREGYARATSAQALAFEEGTDDDWTSVSLIGVSFSKGTRQGQAQKVPQLTDAASQILAGLGIFTTKVAGR